MLFYTHVNEDNAVERDAMAGMAAQDLYVIAGSGERVLALLDQPGLSRVYFIDPRRLFRVIRWFLKITGLLFDPPQEGQHINTLQVRHLAGDELAKMTLLMAANNMACAEKLHSVSMLVDARDTLKPANWVTYRYQLLMYANGKGDCREMLQKLKEEMIFFDIVYG